MSKTTLIIIAVVILVILIAGYFYFKSTPPVVGDLGKGDGSSNTSSPKPGNGGGINYSASTTTNAGIPATNKDIMLSMAGKFIYAKFDNVQVREQGTMKAVRTVGKNEKIGFAIIQTGTGAAAQTEYSKGYVVVDSGNIFKPNWIVLMSSVTAK